MPQLKRRLWILLAVVACLAAGVFLLLQNLPGVTKAYQDYCSIYEVWGRVADFGTDSSVEATKVSTADEHTYTNWEGNFFLSRLAHGAPLTLGLPDGYEAFTYEQPSYGEYTQRLTCQRIIRANYFPVPGVKLTLQRVLEAKLHRNYDYLWSLMVSDGQRLWVDKITINIVLALQDKILDKLEKNRQSYKIIENEETVADWVFHLTGKKYPQVKKYQVEWQLASGEKITEDWFLVKEAGFWHYFPQESKAMVDTFIADNKWVTTEKSAK
ncbi:MAG: hypothetical protein Q8N84_00015 [bacterium]|nr:hypothetical protein [bacterium]